MTRTGGMITIRSGTSSFYTPIAVEKIITHNLDINGCICKICNARFRLGLSGFASCGDLTCNEVIIKSIIE